MKERVAAFTGHRNIDESKLPQLLQRLDETIAELIEQGIIHFLAGGAVGFDYYASLAVLKHRENNPYVKLFLLLPCRDWDSRWSEADRRMYQRVLDEADYVKFLVDSYYDGCMRARNLKLVKHSSVCVAYKTRERSGAAQTVRFAREGGLQIINLAEFE